MSIKKNYLKTKPICKVTFRVSEQMAETASKANLVGDFNNWNIEATPMKKLKSGAFTTTIGLEFGNKYQFRYLVDGRKWENDPESDDYIPTPFGDSENSVIFIQDR